MIRCRTILVTALLVFAVGCFAGSIVFKTQGPHTWFRAHQGLKQATLSLEEYHSLEGKYPDEETVNFWVDLIWEQNVESSPKFEGIEFDLLELHRELARGPLIKWNQPVYVVSDRIPGGRGFYSPGDDGKSLSNGNDADDINSWDGDSKKYYLKKERRIKWWQNAKFASLCSMVLTLFLIAWRSGQKEMLSQER